MFKLCVVYIYIQYMYVYVYSAYMYRIHINPLKWNSLPPHRRLSNCLGTVETPQVEVPFCGGDASSVAATWWLCKRRETRDRSRVMWEAAHWKMPKWMSKKKIVGPIPYYYDISNYYILLWSLPSKTSLFNEMAPAKKIYVTNGNTPRNATGRQGTARRAKSTPLGHFDIL